MSPAKGRARLPPSCATPAWSAPLPAIPSRARRMPWWCWAAAWACTNRTGCRTWRTRSGSCAGAWRRNGRCWGCASAAHSSRQAREDDLFSGAPGNFVAFHWHGDAFTLPRGAVPLASSTLTPLQAFRCGSRAWGLQFHLEVDEEVLGSMMSGEAELLEAGVDPAHLRAEGERELPRLREIARAVFARWAALL